MQYVRIIYDSKNTAASALPLAIIIPVRKQD